MRQETFTIKEKMKKKEYDIICIKMRDKEKYNHTLFL